MQLPMMAGTTVRVVDNHANDEYFEVGDLGVIKARDSKGDYVVYFPDQNRTWFCAPWMLQPAAMEECCDKAE